MKQVKLQNQADSQYQKGKKDKTDIFDEVIEKVARHRWHQLVAELFSLLAVAIEGRQTLSQSGQVETADFVLVWYCAGSLLLLLLVTCDY